MPYRLEWGQDTSAGIDFQVSPLCHSACFGNRLAHDIR